MHMAWNWTLAITRKHNIKSALEKISVQVSQEKILLGRPGLGVMPMPALSGGEGRVRTQSGLVLWEGLNVRLGPWKVVMLPSHAPIQELGRSICKLCKQCSGKNHIDLIFREQSSG